MCENRDHLRRKWNSSLALQNGKIFPQAKTTGHHFYIHKDKMASKWMKGRTKQLKAEGVPLWGMARVPN